MFPCPGNLLGMSGGIWVVAAPEGLRLFPEDGGAVLEGLGWAVLEELWLPIVKVRVSPEV